MSEHAQVDDRQVFCWLVYFMFGLNTSIETLTAYLFASATNSFGFWNDLKEDDIDNCAGRNT